MTDADAVDRFILSWSVTGGSELANTQSFINELCALIGVESPRGSRVDDAENSYVFERRVFENNGDGTSSFGRLDCYKKGSFVLALLWQISLAFGIFRIPETRLA